MIKCCIGMSSQKILKLTSSKTVDWTRLKKGNSLNTERYFSAVNQSRHLLHSAAIHVGTLAISHVPHINMYYTVLVGYVSQ